MRTLEEEATDADLSSKDSFLGLTRPGTASLVNWSIRSQAQPPVDHGPEEVLGCIVDSRLNAMSPEEADRVIDKLKSIADACTSPRRRR
jgi:hypothetical protein